MSDFSKRWNWHKEQQPGSICLVCTHASCISALWSTVPPYLVLTTLFTLQMQPTCKSFEFLEQLLITWTIYCLFTTSEWPREIHIYGNDMTQGLPKWYFPIQTSETAMFYDKTYFNANPRIDYFDQCTLYIPRHHSCMLPTQNCTEPLLFALLLRSRASGFHTEGKTSVRRRRARGKLGFLLLLPYHEKTLQQKKTWY